MALIAGVTACAHSGDLSAETGPRVSLMTFNVENLFDARDDAGKNDETFLPLATKKRASHIKKCNKIEVEKWREECLQLDWSEAAVAQKITQIAKVIRSANAGQGADVVFLQEIENERVLKQLLAHPDLASAGYQPILIEGSDVRGIDVAMITKLKVQRTELLTIPFGEITQKRKDDTRGILHVEALVPGVTNPLSLYVLHLPAPFHPTALREDALKFLDKTANEALAQGHAVVAAGDFNITGQEEREKKILEPYLSQWQIAHRLCRSCKGGSSYYPKDKTWSYLDQMWFRSGGAWRADLKTIRIVNDHQPLDTPPESFALENGKGRGVSDHFPLYMEIVAVKEASKPSGR
ncbi:MAG TPA: endonuclease/exonuclease/phosphatase family protein [Bdellovibrionota bacterium]|nr:endonuclease/exonuclease/phosphatase family protein [Bdellovibrionota bacterium]